MRKLLTVILVLLLIGCSIFVFKSFHKTSGVRDTWSDADGSSVRDSMSLLSQVLALGAGVADRKSVV